jgi:HK97 gp10 family phage protein
MAKVTGTAEFRAALNAGSERQRHALRAELERLGGQMADEIRASAPRKTGALAASIRYEVVDTDKGEKLRLHIGDKTAYYASFVEYGHGTTPAHPFVRPVLATHKAQIAEEFSAVITTSWGEK